MHLISVYRGSPTSLQKVFYSNPIQLRYVHIHSSGQFQYALGGRYFLSLGMGKVGVSEVRILG